MQRKTHMKFRPEFSVPFYSSEEQKRFPLKDKFDGVRFSEFAQTIQNGDNEKLNELLNLIPEGKLELVDPIVNINPLHVAAKINDMSTWKVLLSHDTMVHFVDAVDNHGITPLMAAAWYNNHLATTFLLEIGADTSIVVPESEKNALHFAATQETSDVATEILKYNSDASFVNAVDKTGNTPLLLAVSNDSPAIKPLLEYGADVNITNRWTQRSVLHAAVIGHHHQLLAFFLEQYPQPTFIDGVDINGDTPVMVAIRLEDTQALKVLLTAPVPGNLSGVADISGDTSLHMAIKNDRPDLLKLLLRADTQGYFINVRDRLGRTPLMYAIEKRRLKCIWELIRFPTDFRLTNPITGDTILHVAVSSKDWRILQAVLAIPGIEDIVDALNFDGLMACEIAFGRAGPESILVFQERNLLTVEDFKNHNGESALFIAAREANYRVTQALLVSDSYYANFHDDPEKSLEKLLRAEIQHDIYSSDVFILTGIETSGRGWDMSPPQTNLFRRNHDGQNIYHACALGENLELFTFIHLYCMRYRYQLDTNLDESDNFGNTPFMLAIQSGSDEVAKYLLRHGANLARTNRMGLGPLDVIETHLPKFQDLIREVLNECVVYDVDGGTDERSKILEVSCELFCPPGYRQMHILSHIFNKLYHLSNIDILRHPVIESFTTLKWARLRNLILLRFILNCATIFVFSSYLTVTLCSMIDLPYWFIDILWWLSITLSAMKFTFALPYLYSRGPFGFFEHAVLTTMIISAPICSITYLLGSDGYFDNSHKLVIGAWGVLLLWCSVIVYGGVTRLEHQIALFQRVLWSIMSYFWVCAILILGFAFCFFVLFHSHFSYNNPYHSMLYTFVVMFSGAMSTNPVFSATERIVDRTSNLTERELITDDYPLINPSLEMQLSLIEGGFLVLYEIFVLICMVNMMVGLAVKGGTELKAEGRILKTRTRVRRVDQWERFIDSQLYRCLWKLRLLWLIGVPQRLREHLEVPLKYYPLSEMFSTYPLDLEALKSIAVNKQDISLPKFQPLLRMSLPKEEVEKVTNKKKTGRFWLT